jgi:uncharacterized membrane protein
MITAPATRLRLTIVQERLPAIALGGLLILGAALRLAAIGSRGLWSDEAWRVLAARQASILDTLHTVWAQPPSAPLYWMGLHVWISLFGHGDVVVRLFSVLASMGAIMAAYWLGMNVAGVLTGLLVAGLLAVSPLAVETGQEATMYAWSMLFATSAIAAGISWLQTGRGGRLYAAIGILLLYTHYIGALLLVEMLVLGLVGREALSSKQGEVHVGRAEWVKAHGVMLLLWVPWLAAMGLEMVRRWGELSQLHHQAGWAELYGVVVNMGVAASAAQVWPKWQVTAAICTGGFLALIALLTRRPAQGALLALAGLVAGFILAIIGTSALTGAWLVQPRFFTLVLPATLVVLAAAPLSIQPPDLRRSAIALTLLSGLLLAIWLGWQVRGVQAFYTRPVHGQDGLREAAAWLNSEEKLGDLVAANHPLILWSLAQYYDGPAQGLPSSWDVRDGYPLLPPPTGANAITEQWEALSRYTTGAQRIWLLYMPDMDPQGSLIGQMRGQYRQVAERHYAFADVYLFETPAPVGGRKAP